MATESTAAKLATEHTISPAAVRKFATFSQAADTLVANGAPLQRVLEQPKAKPPTGKHPQRQRLSAHRSPHLE